MNIESKRDLLIYYLLENYCNNNNLNNIEVIYNKLKSKNIVTNDLSFLLKDKLDISLDSSLIHYEDSNISKDITLKDNNSLEYVKQNNYKNYILNEKLGNGSYGYVFNVKYFLDNKDYALKIIEIDNKESYKKNIKEVRYMALFDHPNIIRYYYSWIEKKNHTNENLIGGFSSLDNSNLLLSDSESNSQSKSQSNSQSDSQSNNLFIKNVVNYYLFIKMELCKQTLRNFLDSRIKINRSENLNIFKQIVNGLDYLHSMNIIHRDLKPSNIMFDFNNKIKIGDFGMSINIHSNQSLIDYDEVGTYVYLAPECNEGIYSFYSDIYSLGIIFYEMINIFTTEMEKFIFIKKLKNNEIILDNGKNANMETQFIYKLIDKIPENRLLTNNIINILSNLK